MGAIQNAINSMLGSVGLVSSLMKRKEMFNAKLNQRGSVAMDKVATQQEVKKQQRRNFKEYLKKLTFNGGTVGDLPESAVHTIAKQYTKKQRKQIMDEMDAQRRTKK